METRILVLVIVSKLQCLVNSFTSPTDRLQTDFKAEKKKKGNSYFSPILLNKICCLQRGFFFKHIKPFCLKGQKCGLWTGPKFVSDWQLLAVWIFLAEAKNENSFSINLCDFFWEIITIHPKGGRTYAGVSVCHELTPFILSRDLAGIVE